MLYSASTGGFYTPAINGSNIPEDAVKVSAEEYEALMAGLSVGKVISADSKGRPVLTDPPPADPLTREEIEAIRLRAFADPCTGSDRYFAEAVRLETMGDPVKAEAARMNGIVRYQEIKDQNPWPAE